MKERQKNELSMPKRKIEDLQPRKVSLLHWFRKGLRLHDNPSLREGLQKGAEIFRCVYILDPWFAGLCEKGVNRWRFLLDCLEDLDKSLRKLNSRLFLVRGQPADVFPRLFKEWNITHLSFEEDCEPYGRERDQVIKALAQEAGVDVICQRSHTLYDPQEILKLNNNEPPLTYNRFQELISLIGPPPQPVDPVTAQDVEGMDTAIASNHYEKYGIPSLEELGKREIVFLTDWEFGSGYEQYYGTVPSYKVHKTFDPVKRTNKIPLSLHGQLLWREFFFAVGCNNPNLDQMENNQICIQIPWDKNPAQLKRWTEVFEELLLDADWSVNAGNWIWLSCSSFFQQFFHCYCPVMFGRRTDPEGEFIRKYLPVLKNMPTKYIFDPWTAPLEVQKEAKCVIGEDYPYPIVNHAEASHANIEKMKKVFKNISKYCGPGETPYFFLRNFEPLGTCLIPLMGLQLPLLNLCLEFTILRCWDEEKKMKYPHPHLLPH
ncbi:Cryptochrome-1 [Holothuria leucospilota]|uniref:Cryptochrome-1 n=1 Tax=Holothuria leucospilota TaxID=206669 RepID=A0A9Q1BSH4_HOLLE|nr:Cryptochrome-1 [Holothuria leucospilota]